MLAVLEDFRFSLRVMRRSPGPTLVAVLTLALGIAANTAVFSWVDSVLLRPIRGISQPDRLLALQTVTSNGEPIQTMSFRDFQHYRDNLRLVSGIAVAKHAVVSFGNERAAERTFAEMVSGNYFDVLGVRPAIGRFFLPAEWDDAPDAHPVVVLSHKLWVTHFRSNLRIVGQTLRVNRRNLTIVGVAPAEFFGGTPGLAYSLWIPITMQPSLGVGGSLTNRATRDCTASFVRLREGVTRDAANQELGRLARLLAESDPVTNQGVSAVAVPLQQSRTGASAIIGRPLMLLMGVAVLLLLIVCANVANLLLARSVARRKEFAIRLAVGASRWRIARLLLAETLLLSIAGAVVGSVFAVWLDSALYALTPSTDLPVALHSQFNIVTLLVMTGACFVTTVVSGAAPAMFSARTSGDAAWKEAGRSGMAGATSRRLLGAIVVAEVTLAAVALTGAALFLQSFRNSGQIQPGFDAMNVGVAQYFLSGLGYDRDAQVRFCKSLRERLQTAHGVAAAAYSDQVPLQFGTTPWDQIAPNGYTPAAGESMYVHRTLVSPGWFDLLRIPILAGRDFAVRDDTTAPPVMIVNQTFATRYFGGADPVGRRVRVADEIRTIVGMVKDVRYHSLTEPPQPYYYMPFDQKFSRGLNPTLFIRTSGNSDIAGLRREAVAIEPEVSVYNVAPLRDHMGAALYGQRVAAILLTALGSICLLLAAIGLYSVMSYSVGQRRQEIGIRLALGARPADISAWVVARALRLVAVGIAIGLLAASVLSAFAGAMLVGVTGTHPPTYLGVACFLAATAFLAAGVPARRAARTDPNTSLRAE